MIQAIKLTFGSVWGWLGIIIGAISLINLGVMYFEVGIGPVLERVVATYKAIVHQGFDYLFFWIDWKIPPWAKDVAALYIVLGTATNRGFTSSNAPSRQWAIVLFWWMALIIFLRRHSSMKNTHPLVRFLSPKTNSDPQRYPTYTVFMYATLLNFFCVPLFAAALIVIESGI